MRTYDRLPGQVYAGTQRATAFQPVGWDATTEVVRFVGGTLSGPPITGVYQTGDHVVSRDGGVHVCTASGTPGTWTSAIMGTGAQTVAGVKTFTSAPVVPSIVINGFTITAVGGDLFINGAKLLQADDAATPATNTTTTHSHP